MGYINQVNSSAYMETKNNTAVPHGAAVKIELNRGLLHTTVLGSVPIGVRSYKDGLKVGCTFVTNEALEQLYKWHKDYLDSAEKVHQ